MTTAGSPSCRSVVPFPPYTQRNERKEWPKRIIRIVIQGSQDYKRQDKWALWRRLKRVSVLRQAGRMCLRPHGIQVQMWINLKAEGGIRRSTHVSKCDSCYSACKITLYIAIQLHELADRHWQSLFTGLRTSLGKASSSFVVSVHLSVSPPSWNLAPAGQVWEKNDNGELYWNVSTPSNFGYLCTFMTTLVAKITTIASVPKITMVAFATMVTSITRVTYIPLLQLVSKRCADISYHFLFRRDLSIVGNWSSTP